jgi:hypothetical protein
VPWPEVRVSNIEGEILIEGVDGNTVLFEVLQEGGEAARREFPVEKVPRGAELNLSSVNSAVKVVGVVGEQTIATVDGAGRGDAEVRQGHPRSGREHRERVAPGETGLMV